MIFEITEKDKLWVEIYKITNTKNNKSYIGQAVSHRLNKGKYRQFGHLGRFNDHISEAINNTKKNQCTYLNNAIRKYSKDSFNIELIEQCSIDSKDERESYYIEFHKSMHPNGYNLTTGGKTFYSVKIFNDSELNVVKKRGRDFGYVHGDETKKKMSLRLKELKSNEETKNLMRSTMKTYYDNKKVQILSAYDLSNCIENYIKPVMKKNTNKIHDYVIKIQGRKLAVKSSDETLDDKYIRLQNILIKANELNKNC